MQITDEVTALKGIGEKSAKLLDKLQIHTIDDLIHHLPRDYEVFEDAVPVGQLEENCKNAMLGKILTAPKLLKLKRLSMLQFYAGEGEERIRITIFNMPYLAKTLKAGTTYVFVGNVYKKGSYLCMDQPSIYKPESYAAKRKELQPIYAKTKGISNEALTKYIKASLKELRDLPEVLPLQTIRELGFCSHLEALRMIHMPESKEQLLFAKKRLAYEEFFYFLLSMNFLSEELSAGSNSHPMIPVADTRRLIEQLPFRLTASQRKVYEEIENQMCKGEAVVNRLIQGDVGSGKTIVAILCLLLCVANGYQGAFMAPTEVLAVQHYEEIARMTEQHHLPFRPVLLTGSVSAKQKREAKEAIEEGRYNLVIGTHALIEDNVIFSKLALVITDEQHRFGVAQRDKIAGKGENVHTIVMSATPIPRSLAIVLYGNLAVSTISELPANRLPIKNCVVGPGYRDTAHKFILEQVQKGRQAYVICPMVESGIMEELENVKDYQKLLQEKYGDAVRVACLHGKMRPKEKNEIMDSFAGGDIDVLVSTTVIEVGINVPNATVMMVENADRFGLAALHQIRGRVGRGEEQSYCIFVDTKGSEASKKRLDILNHSNDGFHIANEDLKLRGPGDMLGVMQSGDFAFRFADIYDDSAMLLRASGDVKALLAEDRLLEMEEHAQIRHQLELLSEQDYRNVL
ncbi:MAG: ATP-dependent DNA helicase RecG [Lachnospiraceae bacterium]|nr:ATP-dependent DNA helicase RecG [Lachnospiraceae bacterium]